MGLSGRWEGRHAAAAAAICALLLAAACDTAGYGRPIAMFQNAASVVVTAMRSYLTNLNKVERDAFIDKQVASRGELHLGDIRAQEVFSQEGVKARLAALQQLSSYCSLLGQLANNDAPQRVAQEAGALGESVKSLSGTVSSLTHADDAGFRGAVGPASSLFGTVAQLALEHKARAALDEAIKNGAQPVGQLLSALRRDLHMAVDRRMEAMSKMRLYYLDRYNEARQKGAATEVLKQRADDLKTRLDEYETFIAADPAEALDAMAKAHAALLKYAEQKRKSPQTLAELVEAMEAFSARAKRIGDSVHALRTQ